MCKNGNDLDLLAVIKDLRLFFLEFKVGPLIHCLFKVPFNIGKIACLIGISTFSFFHFSTCQGTWDKMGIS